MSSSSSSSSKMITLKSSDGKDFEVEKTVVVQCQTIKHMIEDNCTHNAIPVANVTSKILAKVIEYCKKHVADDSDKAAYVIKLSDDDLKVWDADFIKDIKNDQSTLFELIQAADYLNIKSLLDLTCQTVADMMRGRTPEEIRRIFHIKNDYTPEEEEEVRKEILSAFE